MDMKSRLEILIEDMNSKFDAIMEYVRDIPDIKTRLGNVENDVAVLKDDVSVIKTVVKDHSATLTKHGRILDEHTRQLKEIKTVITKQDRDFDDLKSRQLRVEARIA
jgi:chromosome segregation ATPase